jgi:hypothetical protein
VHEPDGVLQIGARIKGPVNEGRFQKQQAIGSTCMRANGHKPSLNRDAQTGGVWPTETLAERSFPSIVQLRIQLAAGLEKGMQNLAVSLQQWAVFLDPSRGRPYSPITQGDAD